MKKNYGKFFFLCGACILHCVYAVSVKKFGAVGDGKTDDTAAITAALSNAVFIKSSNPQSPADERTVFFPAGTYRVTSTIILTPEYGGLTMTGTRGAVAATKGFGNNFTQDTVLLWDGPKGGALIELWGMKNLRMDEIGLNGNDKAGILLRVNSSDPVSKDKRWHARYKSLASTGLYLFRVTFKNAEVGISLSDDSYFCSDVSQFNELNFNYLDIGIDSRSEQNLSYVILHPSAGWVKTLFKFTGGGDVDAINVNCHHIDTVFDISRCGINSGTYNLSCVRTEQGTYTRKGKRTVMLRASGEVNINMTAVQTTLAELFAGKTTGDLETPAFILGPTVNLLLQSSLITGRIAEVSGEKNKLPSFISFRNCRFRGFSNPYTSVLCLTNAGFALYDCQITHDELNNGVYKENSTEFIHYYYREPGSSGTQVSVPAAKTTTKIPDPADKPGASGGPVYFQNFENPGDFELGENEFISESTPFKGKYSLELKGDGKFKIKKIPLVLEPGTKYRFKAAIRKGSDVSAKTTDCLISIINYTSAGQLEVYVNLSDGAPRDNKWYEYSKEFTTGKDITDRLGMIIYNNNTTGSIWADEIVIEKAGK